MRQQPGQTSLRRAAVLSALSCLSALALGAAISAGWGVEMLGRGRRAAEARGVLARPGAPSKPRSVAKGPRVALDSDTYDFGTLELGGRGSHEFTIRNVGDAPLRLIKGDTTCRCTLIELPQGRLAPGAACAVRLEWEATEPTSVFRHGAVLLTNDPRRRQIRLVVTGRVLSPLAASPGELIFTDVPAGASRQQRVLICSQTAATVELLEASTSLAELSWEVAPATPEELRQASARSGIVLLTTLAAADTPRRFGGTLALRVRLQSEHNVSSEHLLELPVAGNVRDGFAIYGPRWDPDGRLRLGNLPRGRGARHTLYISAPAGARLGVERVSVPGLKVSIERLDSAANGQARFALRIEIPSDTPPLDCMGANEAVIELSTGVASRPTLRARVQFCVLD